MMVCRRPVIPKAMIFPINISRGDIEVSSNSITLFDFSCVMDVSIKLEAPIIST